ALARPPPPAPPPHPRGRPPPPPPARPPAPPPRPPPPPEPADATPAEEIQYRMRDEEPPFLESLVTFQIRPVADGRTLLRILPALDAARFERRGHPAANDAGPFLMRAA
ncbi:polyketide cyclase, partial [Achromobacter aegrifaciens]|uniref:polyketide cyclase n=1 Tax=Achromobacter aegrifaciens TaxID=1287736 RepID=UPI001AD7FD0C